MVRRTGSRHVDVFAHELQFKEGGGRRSVSAVAVRLFAALPDDGAPLY
jgi:hypothetical protein